MKYNSIYLFTFQKPDLGDISSSLWMIGHACCLTNPRPGLSCILCQPHLFLPSSHPNLRQKTTVKKIIRNWFFWSRDLSNKSLMNKWCFAQPRPKQTLQSQAKMEQMQFCLAFPAQGGHGSNSQLPVQLCTDRGCLNWRRNDDAGLFPSRCHSVTMEADSVLPTSLSAK